MQEQIFIKPCDQKKSIKISKEIVENIKRDDLNVSRISKASFAQPRFNPRIYFSQVQKSNYYWALIILRHYIKTISDFYFTALGAKNVDLFMMTNSVSSPVGPGSDSKPINIKLGKLHAYLTDSSQFGFEPLLSTKLDKVYCYLPSLRGEDPDNRHLNQFFHCEMEIIGTLNNLMPIIENYIKILCETILLMPNIIDRISGAPNKTTSTLNKILKTKKFSTILFDEAINLLTKERKDSKNLIRISKHGKHITGKGEVELLKILKTETPTWLTHFDRDTVPFYQKPHPKNKNKAINADLIFLPLTNNSFGGEIVGAGQRQNRPREIYESFKRQTISCKEYEWYIQLRRSSFYKTTSGFGLGIERFIAWILAKENIRDVALYPRLKNIKMYP